MGLSRKERRMKLQVTKKYEPFDNEVIEKYSEQTGWFNIEEPLSRADMYSVLLSKDFTQSQALVTIAALGLVGVAFFDDTIMIEED